VQRFENWYDMREFRSFNRTTCKTVLNLLEAIYLGHRKIVVERVTVVKFRVDNRGSDDTIKLRTGSSSLESEWVLCPCNDFLR